MNRHYLGLWLLLAAALAVFAITSAMVDSRDAAGTIELGGVSLKSSGIGHALTQQPDGERLSIWGDTTEAPGMDNALRAIEEDKSPFPAPVDTTSQVILIVGDSMLEGLSPRLAEYAAANGHELYTVIWYSSTSAIWGQSDKLRSYIERLKPTYIFICLGANELFVSNIIEKRRQMVRNIVADMGNIPFVWIGPPNWKPDTGINQLIAESVPEGCYFKSDGMTFDRARDGAHPTRSSAALWLDSVARWMPAHALHPIRMENPGSTKGKPKRIFVHQPDER